MDKLEKLLDYVIKQRDKYSEFAGEALDKHNIMANMIHNELASAYQRVIYAIEDLMNGEV